MHMRGTPQDMQWRAIYGDVTSEVQAELEGALERALRAGVARDHVIFDPGLGFAKTAEQSTEVLARLGELHRLGRPLLVGPVAQELPRRVHRGAGRRAPARHPRRGHDWPCWRGPRSSASTTWRRRARRPGWRLRCGRLAAASRRARLGKPEGGEGMATPGKEASAGAQRRLFGTDGVRGVANVHPMTAEIALQLGRALAWKVRSGPHRHRIVIGKDTRLSGYMLEQAIASGICSMGVDVLLCGPLPTPGIAFVTQSMRADAGVVISASHNPYQDNGIKFFDRTGFKLPDEAELEIERLVLALPGDRGDDAFHELRPTAELDRQGEAHRRCHRALRGVPEVALPQGAHPRRADGRRRLRQRREPTTSRRPSSRSLGPGWSRSMSSPTAATSTTVAAPSTPRAWPRRSDEPRPTSASRSTETPTGSSWQTRRAGSWTATPSWRSWRETSCAAARCGRRRWWPR